MRRALAAAVFLFAAALAQAGPPLPVALVAELPMLRPLGEGRLRWLGLHVYDSSLWVPGDAWSAERPFALDIRYAMSIKGRDLTERSLAEMKRLGYTDPGKLRRWENAMDGVFPDIRPGDRLVGVSIPGREARFYSQDRFLGAVADPEFARAFFAIWLDPGTSEPKLRAQMLRLEP
ncbi:MAG: chalcone isomerase family protein [Betaproteobacteria bacterium]|nr:chalcone isomerase family protein [Betaproteobacteria bacterium]